MTEPVGRSNERFQRESSDVFGFLHTWPKLLNQPYSLSSIAMRTRGWSGQPAAQRKELDGKTSAHTDPAKGLASILGCFTCVCAGRGWLARHGNTALVASALFTMSGRREDGSRLSSGMASFDMAFCRLRQAG